MQDFVLGYGPQPAKVMIVGEAPGKQEAIQGRPFVGISGAEQRIYAERHGWPDLDTVYMTNVSKTYNEGNPDPTPEEIARWAPVLRAEIQETQPEVIVAVGRYAMRHFLGSRATLPACHGLVHFGGEWATDEEQSRLAGNWPNQGVPVVSVYHPASGLHMSTNRQYIDLGYKLVGEIIRDVAKAISKEHTHRKQANKRYKKARNVSDVIAELSLPVYWSAVGFDTEGYRDAPWSFQFSIAPFTGITVCADLPDFAECVAAVQEEVLKREATWIMHNRSYDVMVGTAMGFDFKDANIWDSMYAAYLLCNLPQGLKPLAWRFLRVQQKGFMETVGRASTGKQVEWLLKVASSGYPKPAKRRVRMNNGEYKDYTPSSMSKVAAGIVKDVQSGKRDKDGNLTDPYARWQKAKADSKEKTAYKRELKAQAEMEHGKMPRPSLGDLPDQTEAIHYASADADLTLRLYHHLHEALAQQGSLGLMRDGMELHWVWEEMEQRGFPTDVGYFERLRKSLLKEAYQLQDKLSREYYNGKPFNPRSTKDVRNLLELRGLKTKKRSKKTGEPSTAKDSIGHLRFTDPAIKLMFEVREKMHLVDSFCTPILDQVRREGEWATTHCSIKTTRTASRRLATRDPNLLALPSRQTEVLVTEELLPTEEEEGFEPVVDEVEDDYELPFSGLVIRNGFVAPPGFRFVSADLSTIEIRVAAIVTGDPLMVAELNKPDADLHSMTAANVFGILREQVTKDQRQAAKVTNFQMLYGASGPGIFNKFREIGLPCWDWDEMRGKDSIPDEVWTIPKCSELVDSWLLIYWGVRNRIQHTRAFVQRLGYAKDMWGMRRLLPGIYAVDGKSREEAVRHAFSLEVQGGAQGCIQNSQRWFAKEVRELQRQGYKVWHLLQVHDELVMMCEEGIADRVESLLLTALQEHHGLFNPAVPILAEASQGQTWGELK